MGYSHHDYPKPPPSAKRRRTVAGCLAAPFKMVMELILLLRWMRG